MASHYSISKRSDGWAVLVDGATVLVCERKKAAIRAVQDAMARDAASADASPHPEDCPESQAETPPLVAAS